MLEKLGQVYNSQILLGFKISKWRGVLLLLGLQASINQKTLMQHFLSISHHRSKEGTGD